MVRDPDRIHRLVRRVRWLDRYRRTLAIGLAIAGMSLVIYKMSRSLDWPYYIALVGVLSGIVMWAAAEIGLAGLTALWDTESSRIVRARGLPAAVVRRRRKRRRRPKPPSGAHDASDDQKSMPPMPPMPP